jgi:beta-mannosidase
LLGLPGINSFNLLFFKPIKDLNLPRPQFTIRVSANEIGYRIRVLSDKMAKNVHLTVNAPGELRDNDFDILPQDGYEVQFVTHKRIPNLISLITVTSLVDTY